MKALIILAHGSRREQSNHECMQLSKTLSSISNTFDTITHAFLECAEPSLAKAIESLHVKAYTDIYIYPYFLNDGVHVSRDIPDILLRCQELFPTCSIRLLEYFGKNSAIATLITDDIALQLS